MPYSAIAAAALALCVTAAPCLSQDAVEATPRVWMCRKDAWQLGSKPAAWQSVGQRCDVITLYIDQIVKAENAELRRFADTVRGRGIHVAIECAGLCNWRARFGNRAAELSFRDEFRKVKPLLAAGGKVNYLQMDGPFRRMLYQKVDGRMSRTEHQSLRSAAAGLVAVMRLWREAVPGLEFYLLTNFPNWGYGSYPAYHSWRYTGEGVMGWGDYKKVLSLAVEQTRSAGIPLRGLTVDNPYDYAIGAFRSNQPAVTRDVDWIKRIRELEDEVEAQGLEFGLIFNSSRAGSPEGGSDAAYSAETLAFVDLYRTRGGTPANYMVQSWYHYPSAYLPETTPRTMTHLVGEVIRRVKAGAAAGQ